MQLAILGVWVTSAIYSVPKFIFSRTIENKHSNGVTEEICIMNRKMFSSKVLDLINFALLYLLPLLVMTVIAFHNLFDFPFNSMPRTIKYVSRNLIGTLSRFVANAKIYNSLQNNCLIASRSHFSILN